LLAKRLLEVGISVDKTYARTIKSNRR
jgi:hypothetical protein